MSPAAPSKQKQQLFTLVGLLGAGVLFAIYSFVWTPMRESRAARISETTRLRSQIEKARKDLKAEPSVRGDIDRIRAELDQIRKTHVPVAVMGSSQILDVQRRLEVLAQASGFEISNVREVGRRPIPRRLVKETPAAKPAPSTSPDEAAPVRARTKTAAKKPERPPAFAGFLTEVGGVAGYDGVVEFLRRMEESNPYVCVTSLNIQGQVEDPTRHLVSIQMEWPVEAPPPPPPPETKPSPAASAGPRPEGRP